MDTQSTSSDSKLPAPGPTPTNHGLPSINSTTNGPANKKRRASTTGSRGVANLTPEQLAKKRANDREAQRAIRERTKGQIEALERKILELTSQQPYQDLQHVIRQKELVEAENEDIKRKLNQVLNILQPLLSENGTSTVFDLAPNQRDTPGLRLDCKPRTTGPPNGVTSMPALAPHPAVPDTPSLRSASSTSTYGASPQALQHTPPTTHASGFATPATVTSYAIDRKRANIAQALDNRTANEKLDVGFILDGRQAHDGRHHTPVTPSYPHPATTPIHTSQIQNGKTPTDFSSPIRAYNNPLRHCAPQCPLDIILLDLLRERRQLAADGLSAHDLIGPAYPSFSALQTPERSHFAHPFSKVYTDIIKTFPDIKNLPEQIAVLYIMFLTMRWQICPTPENYERLPEWVTPLASQHVTPHPAWVDNIPWPRMRDKMVYLHTGIPFEAFFVPYTITLSLNWPYEAQDTLIAGEEGEMAMNPVFERHLRDLDNWSLGPSFAAKFPMLAETGHFKIGAGGGSGWREEIKEVVGVVGLGGM